MTTSAWFNDPPVSETLAKSFGVKESEWSTILRLLGRMPTYAELGVFSVMWSEHCSYKSSRVHLKRLPTTGAKVVQGPGENAGAVDLGDGLCAVFKMESHNHPSYIEPYQGAATGVGGILRDVFTMGARPVAALNSLRFGSADHPKTKALLKGVVAGIAGYGNAFGVPTVGGEIQFDSSYDGNILVNAFALGIARIDGLFFGRAKGVGNPVIYVGAKTGRDGIHGATMASQEFDDQSSKKLPTVQVGDPFKEKLLLEACLEIFAKNCLVGVQDMGAAGLTSSSVEMAARSGSGLELDLDAIPRRTSGLSPYEMLLSESQERMLMVAENGREEEVLEICRKWDLDYAVVGHVTATGRFVCKATQGYDPFDPESKKNGDAEVVVDLPIDALTDEAPIYDRPQREVPASKVASPQNAARFELNSKTNNEHLLSLIGSPNIGSRQWIYRQFDHIVRVGTVQGPGESDAAIIRIFGDPSPEQRAGQNPPLRYIEKYLALSADCNGRHVLLDPFHGAAMAVAECARNIACSGGKSLGLTDCLNFASPENPETMWRIARAIDGIAAACKALDVPVVSGNVSLYNETAGQPILPTPTVAIVGQLENLTDRMSLGFKRDGAKIALLGAQTSGNLAASELQHQQYGHSFGKGHSIDLELEARLQNLLVDWAKAGLLDSAHDLSDGGLGVALTESCIALHMGCEISLPAHAAKADDKTAHLFSEEPSRVLISFDAKLEQTLQKQAKDAGVPFEILGETKAALEDEAKAKLRVLGCLEVDLLDLDRAHQNCLNAIVE